MLAHIGECRRVVIVVIITCAKAHNRRRRRRRWVKCTSADTNKQISHMRWNAQLLRPATPLATIDNDRRRVVHNNNKIRCILWIIEKICKHFYRIIHERIGRLHHTHTQLLTCCGAVQCLVYEERKENNIVRDVSSSITVNSDIPGVTPALRLCWFY